MSPNTRLRANEADLIRTILREEDAPIEAKTEALRSLRRRSAENESRTDHMMLSEIERLRKGLRQAQSIEQQLRETFASMEQAFRRLTAPPLYPATFLELRTIGETSAALVHYSGSFRLVHLADGFDRGDVQMGDQVLLSGDHNIVVGKVAGAALECGETATFERYTADGRLVLSCRDEETIVNPAKGLGEVKLKRGDEVRWSPSAHVAFEKIERSSAEQFFLEEKPDATFDDIGGHDAVIEELKNTVLLHVIHKERAKSYRLTPVRSVFFYGPPGVGKTMLVKGLVNWLGELSPSGRAKFINVKPGQLGSMWYSETERKIREVFHVAREAAADDPELPVVLFFDEVDWIATARGGHVHRVDDRAVQTFAVELQGMESRGNVLVVTATNRRDILDEALIRGGRLGDKVFKLGRPNRAAARAILSKHFREDVPYAAPRGAGGPSNGDARAEIIEATLSTLFSPNGEGDICRLTFRDGSTRIVKAADVLTGAALAKLARDATERACSRDVATGERGIRMDDVSAAVADEIRSVAGLLTPTNCFRHLSDLPQDVDVVSVEPMRRRPANALRYLRAA